RAKALQPAGAGDFFLTGADQFREGRTNEAVRSLREALRLQPNHFEAQCLLAISSQNAGRPGEAHIGLTACIGQRPRFAWTYLVRGLVSLQLQSLDDASEDFATALDLDSGEH